MFQVSMIQASALLGIGTMASGLVQQAGKLLVGGRDPNGVGHDRSVIGRDHHVVAGIIAWFVRQRRLHWRSLLSPMPPSETGLQIALLGRPIPTSIAV
jgi:hypothetical protein